MPLPGALIFNLHIPQLHVVSQRNHQALRCLNPLVLTFICGIRKPVPAAISCFIKRLPDRLPGNTPVIAVRLIAQIHVMPRTVHRHPVRTESCDAVILRRLVKKIAACRVVHHRTHILHPDVIRPGNRHVDAVNAVFPVLLVKISISHLSFPPFMQYPKSYELPEK